MVYNFRGRARGRGQPFRGRGNRSRGRGRGEGLVITVKKREQHQQAASFHEERSRLSPGAGKQTRDPHETGDLSLRRTPERKHFERYDAFDLIQDRQQAGSSKIDLSVSSESLRITVGNDRFQNNDDHRSLSATERLGSPVDGSGHRRSPTSQPGAMSRNYRSRNTSSDDISFHEKREGDSYDRDMSDRYSDKHERSDFSRYERSGSRLSDNPEWGSDHGSHKEEYRDDRHGRSNRDGQHKRHYDDRDLGLRDKYPKYDDRMKDFSPGHRRDEHSRDRDYKRGKHPDDKGRMYDDSRYERDSRSWSKEPPRKGFDLSPRRDRERSPRREYERSPRRDQDLSPWLARQKSPRPEFERSPRRDFERLLGRNFDRSPRREFDGSPRRDFERSPRREFDRSPGREFERSPKRQPEKSVFDYAHKESDIFSRDDVSVTSSHSADFSDPRSAVKPILKSILKKNKELVTEQPAASAQSSHLESQVTDFLKRFHSPAQGRSREEYKSPAEMSSTNWGFLQGKSGTSGGHNTSVDVDDEEMFLYGSSDTKERNQPKLGSEMQQSSIFPLLQKSSSETGVIAEKEHSSLNEKAANRPSNLPFWMRPDSPNPVEEEKVAEKEGELDHTVQNILKSIGFNFDLSKRMQELAKQKKQKETESQFSINQSASFLGGGLKNVDINTKLFNEQRRKSNEIDTKANSRQSAKDYESGYKETSDERPGLRRSRDSSSSDRTSQSPQSIPKIGSHPVPSSSETPVTASAPPATSAHYSPYYGAPIPHTAPVPYGVPPGFPPGVPPYGHMHHPPYDYHMPSYPYPPNYSSHVNEADIFAAHGFHAPSNMSSASSANLMVVPLGEDRKEKRSSLDRERSLSDDRYRRTSEERKPPTKREREKSPEYSRIVIAPKARPRQDESPPRKVSKYPDKMLKEKIIISRKLEKEDRWSKEIEREAVSRREMAIKKEMAIRKQMEIKKELEVKKEMELKKEAERKEAERKEAERKEAEKKRLEAKKEMEAMKDAEIKKQEEKKTLSAAEKQKLVKECEEQKRKLKLLERELDKLKRNQNENMRKRQRQRDGHKDPLLLQNSKLQDEISAQIKILRQASEKAEKTLRESSSKVEKEPILFKISAQRKNEKKKEDVKYRHEFYDQGNHWCSVCNILSETLLDYLTHLHCKQHKQKCDPYERPWSNDSPATENEDKNATVEVSAVKGVEFLVSTDAFYCTLCSVFSGDQMTAEAHLKSEDHFQKYKNHVKQNEFYEKRYQLEKQAALAQVKKEKMLKARMIEKQEREEKSELAVAESQVSDKGIHEEKHKTEILDDKERETHDVSENVAGGIAAKSDRMSVESTEDKMELDDGGKSKIAIKLTGKTGIKPQPKVLPPWTPVTAKIPTRKIKPKTDAHVKKAVKVDSDEPASLDNFLTISGPTTTKRLPVYKLQTGFVKKTVVARPKSPEPESFYDEGEDDEKKAEMKLLGIEPGSEASVIPKKPPPPRSQNLSLPEQNPSLSSSSTAKELYSVFYKKSETPGLNLDDIPMPPAPPEPPVPYKSRETKEGSKKEERSKEEVRSVKVEADSKESQNEEDITAEADIKSEISKENNLTQAEISVEADAKSEIEVKKELDEAATKIQADAKEEILGQADTKENIPNQADVPSETGTKIEADVKKEISAQMDVPGEAGTKQEAEAKPECEPDVKIESDVKNDNMGEVNTVEAVKLETEIKDEKNVAEAASNLETESKNEVKMVDERDKNADVKLQIESKTELSLDSGLKSEGTSEVPPLEKECVESNVTNSTEPKQLSSEADTLAEKTVETKVEVTTMETRIETKKETSPKEANPEIVMEAKLDLEEGTSEAKEVVSLKQADGMETDETAISQSTDIGAITESAEEVKNIDISVILGECQDTLNNQNTENEASPNIIQMADFSSDTFAGLDSNSNAQTEESVDCMISREKIKESDVCIASEVLGDNSLEPETDSCSALQIEANDVVSIDSNGFSSGIAELNDVGELHSVLDLMNENMFDSADDNVPELMSSTDANMEIIALEDSNETIDLDLPVTAELDKPEDADDNVPEMMSSTDANMEIIALEDSNETIDLDLPVTDELDKPEDVGGAPHEELGEASEAAVDPMIVEMTEAGDNEEDTFITVSETD